MNPSVLKTARDDLEEIRTNRKLLETQVASLTTAQTLEQIESELTSTKEAIKIGTIKLQKLSNLGENALVTPAQRDAAKATLERFRKSWVQRKRMVMDIVDGMIFFFLLFVVFFLFFVHLHLFFIHSIFFFLHFFTFSLIAMSEALEKKPKVLLEELGIETDEDAKVNIRDFSI